MNQAKEVADELIDKINKLKAENAKLKEDMGVMKARLRNACERIKDVSKVFEQALKGSMNGNE